MSEKERERYTCVGFQVTNNYVSHNQANDTSEMTLSSTVFIITIQCLVQNHSRQFLLNFILNAYAKMMTQKLACTYIGHSGTV